MAVAQSERDTLRELARRVAEIATLPIQRRRKDLWLGLNALKPERPMVLTSLEDRPWGELLDESRFICQDPMLREWETNLRRRIFHHENVPDDRILTDALDVPRVLPMTPLGLDISLVHPAESDGSYTWTPSLRTEADLDKLQFQTVAFDRDQTRRNYDLAREIFGDILNVRIRGGANIGTWFTGRLSFLHGLEPLLTDLYDNPRLIHRAMEFQRDNMNRTLDQYQALGVLSINTEPEDHFLMGGNAYTDQLPQPDYADSVRLNDMWAYGECQEFAGVGPEQFYEFSLQYEAPVLRRFGLVAYGCCEPLDRKFDLVIRHLPNLRLVSVSPWCDRRVAAQKLGNRYVYAWKPNPAMLCSPSPEWEGLEKLTRETLQIARGCCVEIVMKDMHTVHRDAVRLRRWTELAMRLAQEAAGR